jgi:hypothetical protein
MGPGVETTPRTESRMFDHKVFDERQPLADNAMAYHGTARQGTGRAPPMEET